MQPRIFTTRETARQLGFVKNGGEPNARAFKRWADQKGIKPIYGEKHHLWWDVKSIELFLDRMDGIQPESADHDDIIFGRLAGGEDAREISAYTQL